MIQCVFEGMSVREAMHVVKVRPRTIVRWLKQDDKFSRAVKDAEATSASLLIRGGLHKLAQGYEEVVNKEEWIEENANGDMIKRSKTSKQIAPNIQAISKLAAKYHSGEYNESTGDMRSVSIMITQKDRSLTIAERMLVLEGDKAPETLRDVELDANDIKLLEGLEVVPPTED